MRQISHQTAWSAIDTSNRKKNVENGLTIQRYGSLMQPQNQGRHADNAMIWIFFSGLLRLTLIWFQAASIGFVSNVPEIRPRNVCTPAPMISTSTIRPKKQLQ